MSELDAEDDSSDVECPSCTATYATRARLGMHHKAEHGESLVEYERRLDGGEVCPFDGCSHVAQAEYGVKQHHRKEHGSTLARCVDCESWFTSELPAGDARYCDECGVYDCPDCAKSFPTEKGLAQHHGFKHDGSYRPRREVICHNCGETKEVIPAREDNDRHFCDEECKYEWMAEYMSGENSPVYSQVTVECFTCGDELKRHAHELDRSERFFCGDKDCQAVWRQTIAGPKHPRWKGGRPKYYGPNWQRQRKKVLERDNSRCVVCGMETEEHLEMFGEGLHVHHIRPLLTFKKDGEIDYIEANKLSNLITLCEPDHDRWEGIPLSPSR